MREEMAVYLVAWGGARSRGLPCGGRETRGARAGALVPGAMVGQHRVRRDGVRTLGHAEEAARTRPGCPRARRGGGVGA